MLKLQPTKTFQRDGKWVHKPTRSEILVCSACANKYIKTRPEQKICVKCMAKEAHA